MIISFSSKKFAIITLLVISLFTTYSIAQTNNVRTTNSILLWSKALGTSDNSPLVLDNNQVITLSSPNQLSAFSASTGKLNFTIKGIQHFFIENHIIYGTSANGFTVEAPFHLYGISTSDGKILFDYNFNHHVYLYLVKDGIAYLADDKGLFKFRLADKKILWRQQNLTDISFITTDYHTLFITSGMNIIALNSDDGKLLWNQHFRSVSRVLFNDRFAFSAYSDVEFLNKKMNKNRIFSGMVAVNKQTGSIDWRTKLGDGICLAALHNDVIVVSLINYQSRKKGGGTFALDAKTGRIIWQMTVTPISVPTIYNHHVYFKTQDAIYIVDLGNGTLISKIDLHQWTPPPINNPLSAMSGLSTNPQVSVAKTSNLSNIIFNNIALDLYGVVIYNNILYTLISTPIQSKLLALKIHEAQ